jgi:hypothetical protein
MANYKSGAERRNDRMHKIFETARKLEAEKVAAARESELLWLVQRMRGIQRAHANNEWTCAEYKRSMADWIERADRIL